MTATTERAELMHFSAHTPQGALHLELPARHGSDAVGAALALADAEPLLVALETWLALSLDPVPQPSPATPPAGLVWCSTADNAHLGLPWPLLAQAPPSGMPVLHGPELELRVEVAHWPALPAPPDAATGGLLLLPASFGGSWQVTLVQDELGFEIDAHWAGPGHTPTLAGAPRAAEAGAAAVRLVQTVRWPLPAVLGWSQTPETPLSDAAQAWAAGAAQASCSGRIVPALGGAGLWVPAAPVAPASVESAAAAAAV